ncbi:MAG TPA: M20/M25/M40 family metallo-hydrolase, partial [Bryobacteraceae bacterium]|nr:M20/M25/M40 family metallo-hydrolase [Bryobacteraceae bacterium]
NSKQFCRLAGRLMRHPAAPYHEEAVSTEVERICAEQGLRCQRDRYGNLIAKYQNAGGLRPLVLAAHLDHPGFEIVRARGSGRWEARFRGGVPGEYFRRSVRLRLLPGREPARLGKALPGEKHFEVIAATTSKSKPVFAVWELEDFTVRRGHIHGRACDDLIGAAAALATLIELKRSRARANVIAVLARAEEVGFHGALAVAAAKALPKDSLIISLETSKELPSVKMGQGVIIRVGDRASIFDSDVTRFLSESANELKQRDHAFSAQRALMSGGTCEGTAYQEYGYQTAAMCVALGNYHNCGPRKKIAAEFVSVFDACSMVALLVGAARRMRDYRKLVSRLPRRLDALLREARRELVKR